MAFGRRYSHYADFNTRNPPGRVMHELPRQGDWTKFIASGRFDASNGRPFLIRNSNR